MNAMQLVLAGLFVASLILVYRKELLGVVNRLLNRPTGPTVRPSIAISLADDIKSVTQLRDRLAAEGCKEGVEACTVLLRVIVEYQEPSKGVV